MIKCYECEKSMTNAEVQDGIAKTPYGSYGDEEPPEDDVLHRACWDALSEERKEGIRVGSWAKPHTVKGGDLV